MRTPIFFASLFSALGLGAPVPPKVARTGLGPDGIKHGVTLVRWTEVVKGAGPKVNAGVYLDFDDCEDCGEGEDDWDVEDWDDDAADWMELPPAPVRPEGMEGSVRVLEYLWRPEELKRDVDVWRTRLGEE